MTKKSTKQTFLIHYGELGLKGKNRKDFEKKLQQNISASISEIEPETVIERKHRYFMLNTPLSADSKKITERLHSIFGISWFAHTETLPSDATIDEITKLVLTRSEARASKDLTFSVDVKRANKQYPMISPDIEKAIGESLLKNTPYTKLSFKDPNHTYFIEINQEAIFIYDEKHRGAGGLPVGSSGKVLVLLSGGIDSPVAAYMMAKRGCNIDFLHFYVDEPKRDDKMIRLTQAISKYTGPGTLHLAPYLPFNMAVLDINTRYELVLFRRFMMKVAENHCKVNDYDAIVTGDSLGQVASQTATNLAATNDALESTLCFRPIIAFDKQEIVDLAKKIGTFDISNEHDKDCCSIIDRHAKTRVTIEKIRKEEEKFDEYQSILDDTTKQITKLKIA